MKVLQLLAACAACGASAPSASRPAAKSTAAIPLVLIQQSSIPRLLSFPGSRFFTPSTLPLSPSTQDGRLLVAGRPSRHEEDLKSFCDGTAMPGAVHCTSPRALGPRDRAS